MRFSPHFGSHIFVFAGQRFMLMAINRLKLAIVADTNNERTEAISVFTDMMLISVYKNALCLVYTKR
jgi:hypothetical protein